MYIYLHIKKIQTSILICMLVKKNTTADIDERLHSRHLSHIRMLERWRKYLLYIYVLTGPAGTDRSEWIFTGPRW